MGHSVVQILRPAWMALVASPPSPSHQLAQKHVEEKIFLIGRRLSSLKALTTRSVGHFHTNPLHHVCAKRLPKYVTPFGFRLVNTKALSEGCCAENLQHFTNTVTNKHRLTRDHSNTTAITWELLASKWLTNTRGS